MTQTTETDWGRVIDRIYVINLASRTDRRREMLEELAKVGLSEQNQIVSFFDAVRPDDPGPFSSIGARGCFLSQLGVLKQARDRDERAILLLEDDAAFTSDYIQNAQEILAELDNMKWAIAYLGHRIVPEHMPGPMAEQGKYWRRLNSETGVECAHAVLFHHSTVAPLIAYLEQMLARPAGHAEGGPMHVDGAYSWFRRAHPDLLTLVTPRQYIVQRASKSDIAQSSWKDSLPLISWLRRLKNRVLPKS